MKRPAQSRAKDLPSQLFAANPALFIGAAFEIGMLLGRRSGRTAMGRKVRENVHGAMDQAIHLAPDSVVNLVPQLAPAKPRARKRAAKKPVTKTAD
jgi:hypothetical protein